MKEFNWQTFKGKLVLRGLTIKQWLKENDIDQDRYKNIRYKVVQPTDEEIKLFKSVLEG